MSVINECTTNRQYLESILSVASVLKHSIDLSEYISIEDRDGYKIFSVDKKLYLDVFNLIFNKNYNGITDSEGEIFLNSCYNAIRKFRAMIYSNCLSSWKILYNDIPLKVEMVLGDVFFFARNEREDCLQYLQSAINVYGLEHILMDTPVTFFSERISDKLPYGTSVRWMATIPMEVINKTVTFSFLNNYTITVFDLFMGYQTMTRIQAQLELELLQNYKVCPGDMLATPYDVYTLHLNPNQRSLYWTTK